MTTVSPSLRRIACCGALALVFAPGGCRENDPAYEVITLEGKVEKIDARPDGTGEITVVYFNEKRNQEMHGTGTVNRETEVMINGVLARLEDIRVGERIRGEVRIAKKGTDDERIALKIYVDRAQPVKAVGD
ncbi:MAG: hypothetical protein ACE5HE_08300 [Phycisphaerae bacterium]